MDIAWLGLVFLRAIACDLTIAILTKVWAKRPERNTVFMRQYIVAAVASFAVFVGVSLVYGMPEISSAVLVIMAIGAANAFGSYCHWRAIAISQARTAILSVFDDLIAMSLGWLILGEGSFFSPTLGCGAAMAVCGVAVMSWPAFRKSASAKSAADSQQKAQSESILPWVIGFCVVWGVAIFSMRYFSLSGGMPILTYAVSWYAGSLIGAIAVVKLLPKASSSSVPVQPGSNLVVWGYCCALGMLIFLALLLLSTALRLAPLLAVVPVTLVIACVVPLLVATLIFREHREMTRIEILGLFMGVSGVILVALGYRTA